MSTVTVNVKNILENIRNDIEIAHNLSKLKLALGSLNSSQLAEDTKDIQLGFIFDCLNSSDRTQVLTTCDILTLILSVKHPQIVLSGYESLLIRALAHPVKEVKEMVIKEFSRGVSENELYTILNPSVVSLLIECLCDEEVAVSTCAIDFLTKIGLTADGIKVICRNDTVQKLLTKTHQKDVCKIRMYQLLVDISVKSPDGLERIESSGLFSGLVDQFKSDDQLAIMASLEVITSLAGTVHGYDFLVRNDVVKCLASQILTTDDLLASIVYPGLAKFFGCIGSQFPQKFVALYPEVLRQVFKCVDSTDINISIVSLETLAFIAYSPSGKAVLYKQDEQVMRHVMGKLINSITELPAEWRVRALTALANFMHLDIDLATSEISKVALTWFNQLGTSALQIICDMARQPFPEIKAAAFNVFEKIAVHRWGQQKISDSPGILEFLLDRSTETTLEGKQAKYGIIQTLFNSTAHRLVFSVSQYDRMDRYLQEGVIFVPVANQIAVEGAE